MREDALLLAEWLAAEQCSYLAQVCALDWTRVHQWLLEQRDPVHQAQRHEHPAGPTALDILVVLADSLQTGPDGSGMVERSVRLVPPFLGYLRTGREVEDARELTLTLLLWAGERLAEMMRYEADRISGYLGERVRR
ncbi:hypothetical protein [Kitasatospora sp. NPDC005751]|uniref:hypothetical protein n=1 Tax=Kitasatospora sp. NPDC005751 TaxID=3157064 RepID=UPI0033FA0021